MLCCIVSAVCVPSTAPKSAAASATQNSLQEKFLAKQNTGNFGCKVNSVYVKTSSPGNATGATIETSALREAFSQVATLEWAHIMQTSLSTMDGRNDEKVLATPGGDMGEFIQAVNALSKVTGKTFTQEDVDEMMTSLLTSMTREKFSYTTDEKAYMRLAVNTGCRNLHIAEMGGMRRKKANLLERIGEPQHIGDAFIKYLAANGLALDLNPDYLSFSLAAFHNVLWTSPSKLSTKLCYLELKGPHREAALVTINTPSFCTDQGLSPMVSQQMTCNAPVMVHHPGAVKLYRRELVSILTDLHQADAADVLALMNEMADGNLNKFWASFGAGLPEYSVTFENSSPLLVEDTSRDDDME